MLLVEPLDDVHRAVAERLAVGQSESKIREVIPLALASRPVSGTHDALALAAGRAHADMREITEIC